MQSALPLMPDGSAVILTSSIVGSKGLPANTVHAATNAAIRSFARTWTTDLKARKIRVNAVSPGPIDTAGLRGLLDDSPEGRQRRDSFAQSVPLARMGEADEIAKAVLILASSDSSYVTGVELFVDGGMAQVQVPADGVAPIVERFAVVIAPWKAFITPRSAVPL